MKNLNKSRCPHKRTSIIAIISALSIIGTSGCVQDGVHRADTDSNAPPDITQNVVTTYPTTQLPTTSTTLTFTNNQTTTTTTQLSVPTTTSTLSTSNSQITSVVTTDLPVEIFTEPGTFDSELYTESVGDDKIHYNESDAILLAQLINHEASATWDGKVAVASCVINRCEYFGQSVSDVIFAPNQFTTANSLGYYTEDDYNAAVYVLIYGTIDSLLFYFDGCHPDMKNWFYDVNYNYIGAY